MKHKYIASLLSEIQLLNSRVENIKENKKASFSFFKASFKHTQEITRLLHELEFVQIEEMKERMENLVQFLSDAETTKKEAETTPIVAATQQKELEIHHENEVQIPSKTEDVIHKAEQKEEDKVIEQEQEQEQEPEQEQEQEQEDKDTWLENEDKEEHKNKSASTYKTRVDTVDVEKEKNAAQPPSILLNSKSETILANIAPKNKSLNDVQPVNQTIQDVKRSISLNDRFLFQRELFENNRNAMNTMLTKLQSFSSFNLAESYLKRNTTWDFSDETVDKFLQMLKDSFK